MKPEKITKPPSRSRLSKRIYHRHIRLVREVRDMYIFIEQALAALNAAKAEKDPSDNRGGKDKRYYVPAAGKTKFARRKNDELIAIYDHYLTTGLYETFLVSGVSMFETFLADIFKFVFEEYPQSIGRKFTGISATTALPVDVVFDSANKSEIVEEIVNRHLAGVFYARPDVYTAYLCELTGANRDDKAFADYIEIKATRDLIVHGNLIVNGVYLDKAGPKARGKLGAEIPVDEKYFGHFVGTVTRISGILERDSQKKFPLRVATDVAADEGG